MISRSTAGWLPIEIGFDYQPAVVREALVRWMDVGSTPLAEPFMTHTIDRLRAENPAPREMETDVETLLRTGARLPEVRPAGFIFHISHCGSTLIANALKTSLHAVVVSESRAVHATLRRISPEAGPYLAARWDEAKRAILSSLFSLFAHYRTGQAEPLVLKFVSIDSMSIGVIRSFWPDVPCVMVIRDPVEVMVTTLPGGGWMDYKKLPEVSTALFGWKGLARKTMEMTDEEYCARVLGSLCAAALDAIDDRCMVVDYLELNPAKMREIARFFSLKLPGDGSSVDNVFGAYAKDPGKKIRFKDDRERKQRLASMLARSAANQWVMDIYSELKRRRIGTPVK
jgi:hypothetical protein